MAYQDTFVYRRHIVIQLEEAVATQDARQILPCQDIGGDALA
jgi:hypothetical protein